MAKLELSAGAGSAVAAPFYGHFGAVFKPGPTLGPAWRILCRSFLGSTKYSVIFEQVSKEKGTTLESPGSFRSCLQCLQC